MIILQKIMYFIKQFWHYLYYYIKDKFYYYKNKEYLQFDGYGLHIYTGLFGAGKTTAMVRDAYYYAKKYEDLTILTNIKLINFPPHTNIIELKHYKQIIDAPANTLIVLDEISSIFNSRDWKKEGIPSTLLSHLLQVRKRKKMMFATAQRWRHVDKLIRDITFSVRSCKTITKRWTWITTFDADDIENQNPMLLARPLGIRAFIMTNKIRNLFDTDELVEKLDKAEYIDDSEVLEKLGYVGDTVVIDTSKKKKKRGK